MRGTQAGTVGRLSMHAQNKLSLEKGEKQVFFSNRIVRGRSHRILFIV